VRAVQLDHVEAGLGGHLRGADELLADEVHVGAVISRGTGFFGP
jgi:hypothetical protein